MSSLNWMVLLAASANNVVSPPPPPPPPAVPPPPPTNLVYGTYATTKRLVSWTSAGNYQTRCYRNKGVGYQLATTLASGVVSWQTGDLVTAGYGYAVASYDSSTGLESEKLVP